MGVFYLISKKFMKNRGGYMNTEVKELLINGVTYIPKESEKEVTETCDGLTYVIVRTYSAGVFAGYLENKCGKEVTLRNARRMWYWAGAASLSQLAVDGTTKPEECKFPVEVSSILLTEVIEILDVTKKAKQSINSVPVWKV